MALMRGSIVVLALVSIVTLVGGCGKRGKAVEAPEKQTFICSACGKQFEEAIDPSTMAMVPQAKCPGCGKMAAAASKCSNCGEYYLTSQAMGSTAYNPEEGKPPTLKCPHCGKDPTKAPPPAAK